MLTKEKIIATIAAMPETEFDDIDVLLERIVDLASKEQDKSELNEPAVAYQTVKQNNFGATDEEIPEMIKDIDDKIAHATDLETIYLLKKIRNGLEDSMAGRGITIEEMQEKIDSWFK